MQDTEDPRSAREVKLRVVVVVGVWKASFDLSALIRYVHVSSIVNAEPFKASVPNLVHLLVQCPNLDLTIIASRHDDFLSIEPLVLVSARRPDGVVDFEDIVGILRDRDRNPFRQ